MAAPAQSDVLSVTQLTRRLKALIEERVGHVWVAGEISNWRVSPSGHAYFTLKDANTQLAAVMFRGKMSRLRFEPENGLEVVLNGLVTVYEQRGGYQIICDEMQPRGVGALQLAFEKLKAKLEAEGLFAPEHKKPLPMLPRRIGIVTSPTGAAIRDILNVIGRRFANVHILLYPARVQGDGAAADIAAAIAALDAYGVDVMIVGRGGGSLEDLWAFNEEPVVRAVYNARTPVISAVGHEIDFSLCDFAADMRAPTPSAAAEMVVREHQALAETVGALGRRLGKAMGHELAGARNRVAYLRNSYIFKRPEEIVLQRRQRLDDLRLGLDDAVRAAADEARRRVERNGRALVLLAPANQLRRAADRLAALRARLLRAGRTGAERSRARLRPVAAHLDALSPLRILSRGYAVAWKEPEHVLVRDAGELTPGDALSLRFGAGSVAATVDHIIKETPHGG